MHNPMTLGRLKITAVWGKWFEIVQYNNIQACSITIINDQTDLTIIHLGASKEQKN
jgi:hypothetical protein